MYLEMFPEVIIELQAEIQKHPDLIVNLLQLPKDSEVEEKLGEVAAFVGVMLDGYYNEDAVLDLCETLLVKLKDKRRELVVETAAEPKIIISG